MSKPKIATVGLLLAYLAARVWIVTGGSVFTSRDSFVYAYRDDPALNHGPLVSFIGNAPRPWGVPVFLALFPDDQSRAVGQWALATLVWALLAWEISRFMRTTAARLTALAAVLVFACLSTVANWDFAILSESLSITLGVLVVALLLRWRRTGRSWALWVSVAAAVWWGFTRPDIRFFLVVIIAMLVWLVWRSRGKGPRALVAPLSAAAVLVLAIGWYAAITPAMEQAFKPYDGDAIAEDPMTKDEQWFVYRLRVDVSTDPALWQVYREKLGMPYCAGTEAFSTRATWDTVEFAREYRKCPELRTWVAERQGDNFWLPLAKGSPGDWVSKWGELISHTFGGDIYATVPSVIPGAAEKLVFPSRRWGLIVVLVQFGIGLALALAAGARRAHPTLLRAGLVIAGACLVSSVLAVALGSGEYRRFGLQEAFGIRVAALILLVAALDAWLSRRRRSAGRAGEDVDASVLASSGSGKE